MKREEPTPLQHNVLLHSVKQVYFLRCGEYLKIGYTHGTLSARISALATGNPYPIELWFTLVTPRPKELEKHIHSVLSPYRVKGEWFKMTDEDLYVLEKAIDLVLSQQ